MFGCREWWMEWLASWRNPWKEQSSRASRDSSKVTLDCRNKQNGRFLSGSSSITKKMSTSSQNKCTLCVGPKNYLCVCRYGKGTGWRLHASRQWGGGLCQHIVWRLEESGGEHWRGAQSAATALPTQRRHPEAVHTRGSRRKRHPTGDCICHTGTNDLVFVGCWNKQPYPVLWRRTVAGRKFKWAPRIFFLLQDLEKGKFAPTDQYVAHMVLAKDCKGVLLVTDRWDGPDFALPLVSRNKTRGEKGKITVITHA